MSSREILLRKAFSGRVFAFIPWLLGLLFGAVAVHLILILTLPALAPGSAYRQFARPLPLGETRAGARRTVDVPTEFLRSFRRHRLMSFRFEARPAAPARQR